MTKLQTVLDKVLNIEHDEPYFWRLMLDTDEYNALRDYVRQEVSRGKMHAIRSIPLPIMAYIAEWYKREYDGQNSPADLNLDSADLRQLWQVSGIDVEKFVARDEFSKRWLYSIYVLGGLAARYEMHRGDGGRFLRKLCRLFHGEDIEIRVGEQNALAFRRSIAEEQSLFAYLREIFSGRMPVAETDLTPDSIFTMFRELIINANIQALAKAEKFVLSPALTLIPESDMARLMIGIHMRPEEIGRGCHSYIRYDRMLAWKFRDPDKVRNLRLSLRFLNRGNLVKDADFEHPLIQWHHTGWREAGMICCNDGDVLCRDVPCVPFDTVEVEIQASTGEVQTVGRWEWPGYARLRLKDSSRQLWMENKGDLKETGVVYTDGWIPTPKMKLRRLTLLGSDDDPTEYSINWTKIQMPFALTDGTVTTETFFPSGNGMKVHLRRYPHLIRYNEEGTFSVTDSKGEERELPVIFYREDIQVETSGDDGVSIMEPDTVEYMQDGRYHIWDTASTPSRGILKLRIKSSGLQFIEEVMFLSPVNEQTPLYRDFTSCSLTYRTSEKEYTFKDSPDLTDGLIAFSEDITFNENGASVSLPLLRPVRFRQWIIDGRSSGVIKEDTFKLPWILRDRVSLVSLDEAGVEEYDCSRLKNWDAPDRNFMHIWTEGNAIPATDSDPTAPEWLRLILGEKPPMKPANYLFWSMEGDSQPSERFLTEGFSDKGIGFINPDAILTPDYPFPYLASHEDIDWDDDDFWSEDADETSVNDNNQSSASPLEVFLTACRYHSYFFIFPQLTESQWLEQSNLKEALIDPLKAYDGGRITEEHLKGLERLCAETYLSIDINELRK